LYIAAFRITDINYVKAALLSISNPSEDLQVDSFVEQSTHQTGKHAATDIYDGIVSSIDWEDKIFVTGLQSRRPPLQNIHWRTTRRLQQAALVGIVKLSLNNQSLNLTDRIIWAEVAAHDRNGRESDYREGGRLALNLLDVSENAGFDYVRELELKKGDPIAIIDCQAFVPEHIPVLKALEAQRLRTMPFREGQLLNIGQKQIRETPTEETAPEENVTEEELDDSVVSQQIAALIRDSTLDPIIQIRRHAAARKDLHRKLTQLVISATLDSGQLESFLGSLTHSVHCTQGPPGTGKVCPV
jgi:hypothetical protein